MDRILNMIKKILFPTDSSVFSARASRFAISLAEHYNAMITALHVICVKPSKHLHAESVKRKMIKDAELCFKHILAEERGITVGTRVLVSHSISDAILEEVEEGEYDIIVMGSKGTTGLKKFFLEVFVKPLPNEHFVRS
jgi:nucleotide-binding universal stress UspA family protein